MSKKDSFSGNMPRQLSDNLDYVGYLISENKWMDAIELLVEMDRQYPNKPVILELMANTYLDLKNNEGYLHTMLKLHRLTPNRAVIKLLMADAYLSNDYLALALKTYNQFLKRWPKDERVADVQETVSQLENTLVDEIDQNDVSFEAELALICKYEESRLFMESGNTVRGRQLANEVLREKPDFISALNNLSQMDWLENNLTGAIETCYKVLDLQPENIHALSNLTRFLFMRGQKEEAFIIAQRLKDTNAEAADFWIKKIEALSFIGDDDGVLSCLDQAGQAGELDHLSGTVWHWCAAAAYCKGNISEARACWEKSLEFSPYFSIAAENLEELKKPPHERTCPQVFGLNSWLPDSMIKNLVSVIELGSRHPDKPHKKKLNALFEEYPELQNFIPAALSRGDSHTRKFAVRLAEKISHPGALDFLKDFSLGQEGPDSLRLQTAQILAMHGVFESGQKIDFWMQGERRSIQVYGFSVTYDSSEESPFTPAVHRLSEQAINALRDGDGAKAEGYLRKALNMQPDEPSLLNNLALSLGMQGRDAEASELADRITEEFPDYFFGQIIAARRALEADDLEKSRVILNRLMQTKEMHVTEFSAFCACQIDLLMAEGQYKSVDRWLQMWRSSYPDDPVLEKYEDLLTGVGALSELKDKLFGKSGKQKRD